MLFPRCYHDLSPSRFSHSAKSTIGRRFQLRVHDESWLPWPLVSLVPSITKPGGTNSYRSQQRFLRSARAGAAAVVSCRRCSVCCKLLPGHASISARASAGSLPILCQGSFTLRIPSLSLRKATALCSLLVLPILSLIFKAIPFDSFNLLYCCGKYAAGEQFHGKMLK